MAMARPAAPRDAIAKVFRDPSAVWTLDELARRFGMSIGDAIRVMSDLEAIDFVRRIGDEYVPGFGRGDRLLGGRGVRERLGFRFDRQAIHQLLQPGARQRCPAVKGPEQRTRHGRVRVRVAAERHDVPQSPSSKRHALGRHLEPDPGGEQREAHVGSVDRSRSTRLRDEVLELLSSLPVEHRPHRVLDRLPCASPRTSAAVGERHRQARGAAPLVPVRDRGERRRLLERAAPGAPLGRLRAARSTSRSRCPPRPPALAPTRTAPPHPGRRPGCRRARVA